MKRLAYLLPLVLAAFGCSAKPCQTSNECGASEVCASAHCAALSCSPTNEWYAIDPASGDCRPLPACGNSDQVRGWKSCDDPCKGEGENTCIADSRCQPVYATDGNQPNSLQCAGVQGAPTGIKNLPPQFNGCAPTPRSYLACRPNPLPVDPCKGLDAAACAADARCVVEQINTSTCSCPPGVPCLCPMPDPSTPSSIECRVKTCGDYPDAKTCAEHPECASGPIAFNAPGGAFPPPSPNGQPTPPAFDAGIDPGFDGGVPFQGCFPQGGGSCGGMDEKICLAHPECHPVGTSCYCPTGTGDCKCGGGKFLFCEGDDGLHRCNADPDCGVNERCSNDEQCAPAIGSGSTGGPVPQPGFGAASPRTNSEPLPPVACAGLCVPKGCVGYGELKCNADPTCQPIYQLQCSPYGGGGGDLVGGPCNGGGPVPSNGQPGAPINCGQCEPSFTGCVDAGPGSVVDAGKSVLIRDLGIVDDSMFAFANVMSKISGAADAAPFVERWLSQLTVDSTVGTESAAARAGAKDFLASATRRADGHLDLPALALQATSLSNRLDLAGPNDCGEARITYALQGGASDRRHRMTIIVELGQPDDGAQCQVVAKQWLALSRLAGADLLAGLRGIYQPLLAPAHVHQVRTNEFLVGPVKSFTNDGQSAWELREWHLGSDGDLHLALSKQAVDAKLATTSAFTAWAQQNEAAIIAGSAQVPAEFLAVTSSENGSRISVQPFNNSGHPELETALNKSACAGCHTTETNSAFAHVGERFDGLGRARISEFLRLQLPVRAQGLFRVAQGRLTQSARIASALSNVH